MLRASVVVILLSIAQTTWATEQTEQEYDTEIPLIAFQGLPDEGCGPYFASSRIPRGEYQYKTRSDIRDAYIDILGNPYEIRFLGPGLPTWIVVDDSRMVPTVQYLGLHFDAATPRKPDVRPESVHLTIFRMSKIDKDKSKCLKARDMGERGFNEYLSLQTQEITTDPTCGPFFMKAAHTPGASRSSFVFVKQDAGRWGLLELEYTFVVHDPEISGSPRVEFFYFDDSVHRKIAVVRASLAHLAQAQPCLPPAFNMPQ